MSKKQEAATLRRLAKKLRDGDFCFNTSEAQIIAYIAEELAKVVEKTEIN